MIMMRPQFDEATLRQMLQELMELQKVIHREIQSLTDSLDDLHSTAASTGAPATPPHAGFPPRS